jgi:hypothetical protein
MIERKPAHPVVDLSHASITLTVPDSWF